MKKLTLITILFTFVQFAQAQDDASELAKKLANPVASLISVPFQNNLDHGIGEFNGSRYTLNFQPVIPVTVTPKLNLIARIIMPVVSQFDITGDGNHETGLSDIVASGFFSPSESKNGFTWGAGPVILLPTGTNEYLTGKKLGVGPTVVALKQSNGWTYGALWNQIWSVAGSSSRSNISQMYMNPFVTYNWKSGAGFTTQLDWTHNWQTGKSNLWFIPMFSGLTSFGKQKVSFGLGPRINIAAPEDVKVKFGIRGALVLLFPK